MDYMSAFAFLSASIRKVPAIKCKEFCKEMGIAMKTTLWKKQLWNHLPDCLMLLLCLIFGEQLLFNSSVISESIRSSLILCVDTVIPSLFCFMVLTSFLSATNLGKLLSIPLLPLTKLLCLPADCGSTLLMSFLGGYPVGVKTLRDKWEQGKIDENLLKRLAFFCVCPAPSFVIITVGCRFLNNQASGFLLYGAQVLAALFLALVSSVSAAAQSKKELYRFLRQPSHQSYSSALVNAVVFSSQTLLSMCGYILLFGVFSTLLTQSPLPAAVVSLFSAFLEITGGCTHLMELNSPYLLSIFSFFLSFGGLSVLFQLKNILGDCPCSTRWLFLGRICHGLCSAILTAILSQCFPQTISVFTTNDSPIPLTDPSTPLLSGCLIGMILILLSVMERGIRKKKQNK